MNYFKKNSLFFKKITGTVLAASFLFFVGFTFAHSDTAQELQAQIQKVTENKKQLQNEIDAYQQQLDDLGTQTSSLKDAIKSLDLTINKNTADLNLTQNDIDSVQLQIEELSMNINKDVSIIDQNKKTIATLLRDVNAYDNSSFITNLLIYNDLSDFWNEQQNIYLVQNQLEEKITETKETKVSMENTRSSAEAKKNELLKLKSDLLDRQSILKSTKSEKNKLLSDTQNSEANYKKMLADKKALADSFDKELIQFEEQLKIAFDVNNIPPAHKGILSYPVDVVKITQLFGMTAFAKTGIYNGEGHNGVDFGAAIGTPVKAALSGIVKGTGDTDTACPHASFGKWVFIQHDNGLSTIYAHLSLIKVSEGESVTTGEVIGYSGNTGFTTGPHLHFGVYATQGVQIMSRKSVVCDGATYVMPIADLRAYLDPLQYL